MRSSLTKAVSDGLRDRSGSIQIMGAFMLVVAMGAGAVSVDLIAVQNTSERLQTVAALTCERIERADNALYSNSSDLAATAQQFVREQLKALTLESPAKASVTVKQAEKSGQPIYESELQVAISGEVDTVMAKALGLAGSKIDVTLLCKPTTPRKSSDTVCTEANKAFLVMTSIIDDRITMRSLRRMSKTNATIFMMTLTDNKNEIILRQTVSGTLSIGTMLGNRQLLETDRLHFQLMNADGTHPPFCEGLPPAEPCVGSQCDLPDQRCTGSNCGPPRIPDNSGTCDPTEFIEDARPPRLDPQDAHYDPRATRRWESTNGSLTSYFYRGNYLYKSPRTIEHRIPLAAKFQFNRAGSRVTVEYREIGSGDKEETSSTIEFVYLSKLKGANASTLDLIFNKRYRLVYVQNHDKALWEKPEGGCVTLESPIVIALDGRNTIETTGTSTAKGYLRSPGATVSFDMNGHGRKVWTEWIIGDGGQALLVDNRDGRAAEHMNGTRLFGAEGEFDNGYEKLRMLDTSGTGVLRGSDLDGLAAWIDDGDAVVDAGELVSLSSLGITELGTEIVTVQDDKGFDLMRSWAVRNGRPIMTEDVWFAVTDRAVAAAPEATTPTRK